jgi:murein L,D-transpeptidase YcbB/YkuD
VAARLPTRPRPGAADAAQFDVGLTVAVMRYARDAYVGRVDPQRMGFGLRLPPKTFDVVAVVREAADDAPAERLAALDPALPPFARLVAALAPTRELAVHPDLPAVPALPTLREGDRHPGLAAVRTWLTLWRDLEDTAVPADPALYDAPLAAAVRRFQRRHGRADDGVIGPTTLRDLQVPPAQRVAQIELALERLRWLPARFADRFVVVNVPEFRLRAFEHGSDAPRLTMDVVVGSAARGTETPIMSAAMRAVIFRPSWTVPTSIARNEILPLAARDPSYLERQSMELVDGVVRQRPGPNNALGLVKFELPNPYHVYLHDTPAKALFRRSRRDFSHGCIRVADAVGLAEFALDGTWDRERILAAMRSGPEQRRVALPAPVPIYLLYATAVADGGGRLHFYEDIYGHDARLARALATRYQDPAFMVGEPRG